MNFREASVSVKAPYNQQPDLKGGGAGKEEKKNKNKENKYSPLSEIYQM